MAASTCGSTDGASRRFRSARSNGMRTSRPPGVPVVRRPSGGGAILHGSDLTYAIAVGRSHPWGVSAQRLYDGVHGAAVEVLRAMGLPAAVVAEVDPTGDDVGRSPGRGAPGPETPFLCFDRRSPGDVVVDGCKVLGSAQRRHRSAVVQHGSLLLRRWSALAGSEAGSPAGSAAAGHSGIEDLLGRPVEPAAFIDAWLGHLAASLAAGPAAAEPPLGPGQSEAVEVAAARYRSDAWTHRR
jgi:lipoate-protein ligase A